MTGAKPFDLEEHARYRGGMDHLFGGRNHPEADTTREWVDMRAALGADLFNKARRWAAAVAYDARPGTYGLATSQPGGLWCNSEPAVVAVGRAMEPVVSETLGRRAWLSYAGLIVHFRGVPCVRHRDIGSGSKYLLSWPVLLDIDGGWPLYAERPEGSRTIVDVLDNTSAERVLLFAGHDVHHWRDPYPGEVGRLMFCRYTAFDQARTHTEAEIDRLADAGLAELDGTPAGDVLELVQPRCTSQDLAGESRTHVTVPGLLTAGECFEAAAAGAAGAWPDWVARRLRRAASEAAPALIPGCAFAGHEVRLAGPLLLSAAGIPLEPERGHRVYAALCLETGEATLWRADAPAWGRGNGQVIFAVYGEPSNFVERSRERAR